MSHLIIIGETCDYCSKFRSPLDIIPMAGGAKICVHCEQRHLEALNALSTGTFTGECSECGKKGDELRSADGSMAIHFENGRYRAMCGECDRKYVPKRGDLYGGTEFGRSIFK
jgi:hypothetical protein